MSFSHTATSITVSGTETGDALRSYITTNSLGSVNDRSTVVERSIICDSTCIFSDDDCTWIFPSTHHFDFDGINPPTSFTITDGVIVYNDGAKSHTSQLCGDTVSLTRVHFRIEGDSRRTHFFSNARTGFALSKVSFISHGGANYLHMPTTGGTISDVDISVGAGTLTFQPDCEAGQSLLVENLTLDAGVANIQPNGTQDATAVTTLKGLNWGATTWALASLQRGQKYIFLNPVKPAGWIGYTGAGSGGVLGVDYLVEERHTHTVKIVDEDGSSIQGFQVRLYEDDDITLVYSDTTDISGNIASNDVLTYEQVALNTFAQKSNFKIRGIDYNHSIVTGIRALQDGKIIEKITSIADPLLTELTKATTDSYTTLDTPQKFYDRSKSFLEDNYTNQTTTIVTREGDTIEAGSLNIIIDATVVTAPNAYDFSVDTITIHTSNFVGNINTTGTLDLSNGAIHSGLLNGKKYVVQDEVITTNYSNIVCDNGVTAFSIDSIVFDGDIEVVDGSNVTVTGTSSALANNSTKTETSGTITLSAELTPSIGDFTLSWDGTVVVALINGGTEGSPRLASELSNAMRLNATETINTRSSRNGNSIVFMDLRLEGQLSSWFKWDDDAFITFRGGFFNYPVGEDPVNSNNNNGASVIFGYRCILTFLTNQDAIDDEGGHVVKDGGTWISLRDKAGTNPLIVKTLSARNDYPTITADINPKRVTIEGLSVNKLGGVGFTNKMYFGNSRNIGGLDKSNYLQMTGNGAQFFGTIYKNLKHPNFTISSEGTPSKVELVDAEFNIDEGPSAPFQIQTLRSCSCFIDDPLFPSNPWNGTTSNHEFSASQPACLCVRFTNKITVTDGINSISDAIIMIRKTVRTSGSGYDLSLLVYHPQADDITVTTDGTGEFKTYLIDTLQARNQAGQGGTQGTVESYNYTAQARHYGYISSRYIYQNRNYGVGGLLSSKEDSFIMSIDNNVSGITEVQAQALTDITNSAEFYGALKEYWVNTDNFQNDIYGTRSESTINVGSLNVILDDLASPVFSFSANTITVRSSSYSVAFITTGTIDQQNGTILNNLNLVGATWNAIQTTWIGSATSADTINVANVGEYDATGFTFDANTTLNNSSGGIVNIVLNNGQQQPTVTGGTINFTTPPVTYTINTNISGFYYALLDASNATPNGTDPSKTDGIDFVKDETGDNIWGYVSGNNKVISRVNDTGETSFIIGVQKPGYSPVFDTGGTTSDRTLNVTLEPYTDSAGGTLYTGDDTDSGITDVSIALSVGVLDAPKIYISNVVTPTVYGIFAQLALTYTSPLGFFKLASGERQSLLSRIVGLSDSLFIGDAQLYGEGTSSTLSGYISTTNPQLISLDAEYPVSIQKVLGVDDEAAKLNAYQGFIHVDAVNGTDSSENPYGTPLLPCKTLANAQVIANTWGIRKIKCLSAITADVGVVGLKFYGDNIYPFDMNNQSFTLCGFRYVRVRGVDAETITDDIFEDCLIDANISCRAVFRNCMFDGASTIVTLVGGPSDFLDCNSRVEGISSITVDNSGNFPFNVRGWKGGINLINMTSGELSFGSSEGRLTIDASCGGTTDIVVRGNTRVVNNSSLVINTEDKGYVFTDGLETKAQSDARQALLISEHDDTQALITGLNNLSSAQVANELAIYDGPKKNDLVIRTATAQAGTSTTITLDTSASAINSFYNNTVVYIKSGVGVGQSRRITSYVGSTKVATVANAWQTNPDATSVFNILPRAQVNATLNTTQSAQLSAIETKTQADARQALLIAAHNATQSSLLTPGDIDNRLAAYDVSTVSDITGVLTAIDTLSLTTTPSLYTSTSFVRTIGDNDGGDLTSLQAYDGNLLLTGETASGMELRVSTSTDETQKPTLVRVYGYYSGHPSHSVIVSAYNYVTSSWVNKATMYNESATLEYVIALNEQHHDPVTGDMELRFLHSSGNYGDTHVLNIDYIEWSKVATNSALASDIAQILSLQQQMFKEGSVSRGYAQSSTSNTIVLAPNASTDDGAYDPAIIQIISGTGVGQSRIVLEYDGTTKKCIVNRDWKTLPDTSSEYTIINYADTQSVNEGMSFGGTSNTIILNTYASSIDDVYIGQLIFLVSGTGQDQTALVVGYDGSTRTATIAGNWATTPTTDTAYVMLPASPVLLGDTNHPGTITKLRNQINAI